MTLPTILILEDIPFDAELIQATLDQGGIMANFVSADNREDFLRLLQSEDINIILADYALPDFDGLSALALSKQIRPHIPFILVSGVLGEELAIETLKQGASDYVLKQRLSRLVPAVLRALQESKVRRERQQIETALIASEERFRASVETMLDGFGIYSAIRNAAGNIEDFRIEYVNAAASAQMSTVNKPEMGQWLCQQFPMYRESGLFDAYCQVVETGKPVVRESLLYQEGNPQKLLMALDIRAAKLGDGVVATWRDATSRKLAEQEREYLLAREQAARAEAEAASRIKDEFLATLSHELRTPLNAMQGWIQLLHRRRLDDKTAARAFDTIQRNLDALKRLIDDVLDVSRIIRGKLSLSMAPVDMAPILVAAMETVLPAAQARQIQLVPHLSSSVSPIMGDRNRLQQVIWNLLSNAVKFTPEGGRVDVRLDMVDHLVRVQVQDTGKGIDPAFLPHLFERFRQADSSATRSHTGLGLGLAIVRHLTELHGGTVQAESPGLGQGAIFTVMLPQLRMGPEPSLVDPKLQTLMVGRREGLPVLTDVRVLVVDDEPDARELHMTLLAELGAVVSAVGSVEEALDLIPTFRPDVLVSDLSMPEKDGYTLMQRIREMEDAKLAHLPAIALTAYARPIDQDRALTAGFNLHMPKPVEMHQIAAAVADLAQMNGQDGHPQDTQ